MRKLLNAFFVALLILSTDSVSAAKLMDAISGTPQASGFTLESTNGNSVSLSDFKGKFVLLNFWATWCAPCRKEMPSMSKLHNKLNNRGLEVVGVHVGPSLAGVKKFLDEVPVDFTILIDKDMSLASWGVRGLPTTFLINPEGKLVYSATGEREWDSGEMVKFLSDQINSYKHMAKSEAINVKEEKSLFASFKESIGWKCDTKDFIKKLLPN